MLGLALLIGLPACGASESSPDVAMPTPTSATKVVNPEKPMKLGMPQPKRVGPPDVPPVVLGSIRYEVVHWGRERGLGQNGGYVAAVDIASSKELWVVKVYDVDYKPKLETDVQDVFIKSMKASPDAHSLLITNENNQHFVLDLGTHSAHPSP